LLEKVRGQTYFELRACLIRALYGVALAGRKPAAMRVHDRDKKLFLLSTPCTVNRRPVPFPTPTFSYYLALGSSSPHSPSSPHDGCRLSFPTHRHFSLPSHRRRPHLPAQVMSGSGWDEPPRGKRQRPIPEKPIADRYHESMGWGNLHFPSVENIVERVDILCAARLAVDMIGMRRAIRGTPNLPLHASGLLHSDEFSWPHDRDAQVRVTRFSIPAIYIYIDLLSFYVLAIHRSLRQTPCMHRLLVMVYGLSFPSCMCL
jgi:hypothetical protein